MIKIQSSTLCASIKPLGAELCSLIYTNQESSPKELIWQADPKVWARHAPLLFPIVGRLANDQLHLDGADYSLTQHGFARDMDFQLIDAATDRCCFELRATAETQKRFPRNFVLQMEYQVTDDRLAIRHTLHNPAPQQSLYASIGGHPAFVWPLHEDSARDQHYIEFANDEPQPIRRLHKGLMQENGIPTPVNGRRLPLNDDLFNHDALIFDQLNSHELAYCAPNGDCLRLRFADFPHLGIWTKPGADFVCLEPWQGYASPETFDGDFKDKPGVVSLAPGETRHWQYEISVDIKKPA